MSYSKSFTRRISVPYSGSVSYHYPASQSGGSGTAYYSGTAYEDVNVNVYVDTDPFDASVANTNTKVNSLTGAVAATEAAEIAAIEASSKKVAQTIVKGFFGLIRSDISQQVMELTKSIESHLYHLKEMGKRCIDKQRQMEVDYNRLANNYMKIFADLNSELDHRVHELNRPVFDFRKDCVAQTDRMSSNDLISTVTVSGAEESALTAQIQASFVKKRAMDTIETANRFLSKQKATANTIDRSMIKDQTEGSRYIPVCFMETVGENKCIERKVYQPDEGLVSDKSQLIDRLKDAITGVNQNGNEDIVTRFFNQEVAAQFKGADGHDGRVRNTILKLYNINAKN